jgi:hypothetical protein
MRTVAFAIAISSLWAIPAFAIRVAEPPVETMKLQTIRIEIDADVQILVGEHAGKRGTMKFGGGSGFVVGDGGRVVTNHHVCCDARLPEKLKEKLRILGTKNFVRIAEGDAGRIAAKVQWADPKKDLAVLELERNLDRKPVTFAPDQAVKDRQRVIAMGFPGAAEYTTDDSSQLTVKITDGVISAKVKDKETGTALYQHTATTNPGNSGGPLFDECGRVVGIVQGGINITVAANIDYVIRAEELIPELKLLKIRTDVDDSACLVRPPAAVSALVMQFGSLGLALAALGFAFTRRGRRFVSQKYTHYKTRYSRDDGQSGRREAPQPSPLPCGRPILRGISGPYAGATIEVAESGWVLGRDPRAANLVFPAQHDNISKRHCTVRYDPARQRFLVEDAWSANGTFLGDGRPIVAGQPTELRPGERFYLADKGVLFEVGLEG